MSARVVLDPTVLIDSLRGYPAIDRIRSLRRTGTQLWMSSISIEEIWPGLREGEEQAEARLINALLIAPIDRTVATGPGAWRREYELAGTARNPADFPMPDVAVDHWPVGE